MATFQPPITQTIPNYEVDTPPLVKRCMVHFRRHNQAENVWIVDNTTVQTFAPTATYATDGSVLVWPEDRITRFFQGGAVYTDVSAAHATLLTNAGYTVT